MAFTAAASAFLTDSDAEAIDRSTDVFASLATWAASDAAFSATC